MNQTIERFLESLKAEGRSSPSGMHWHHFWEFLRSMKTATVVDPPVPLILAASGASDQAKQERLRKQLEWALATDCLEQAMAELNRIPADCWNHGSAKRWNQDSHY